MEFVFSDCCSRDSLRWELKLPAQGSESPLPFIYRGGFHDVLQRSFSSSKFRLVHCGVLIAWPQDMNVVQEENPVDQGWHRDENDDPELSKTGDPYVVSAFIPLVDITPRNGVTEFMPGSQLDTIPSGVFLTLSEFLGTWPSRSTWTTEGMKAGDIVLFDARLLHRGMLNLLSSEGVGQYGVRPVLQLTFAVDAWKTTAKNWGQSPFIPD
eukprot:TRINITY_DN67409_c0_g1_i1.p1 TRINITY_DN67409_c0_g1~~TRINITY_DN67409_c0_g1_i1.p1  ORF type:complete len:210 (-),score=21.51 TRINITY_DN67409_c0_g1_i1:132-761(-)